MDSPHLNHFANSLALQERLTSYLEHYLFLPTNRSYRALPPKGQHLAFAYTPLRKTITMHVEIAVLLRGAGCTSLIHQPLLAYFLQDGYGKL